MPSYFFHLKLELYSSKSAATSVGSHAALSTPPSHIFIPPPTTDIFKSTLPGHKYTKWSSHPFETKHDRQFSSESNSDVGTPRSRPQSSGARPESHGDALLLPERNVALKKDSASPALSLAKPNSEVASRDWRFGPVSIESIDMTISPVNDQAKDKTMNKDGKVSNSGLHTKAVYLPSEPKTTDVGWGVVHLYRDSQEAPALDVDKYISKHAHDQDGNTVSLDDCSTLCILAVPSWMMPSDLLGFVGDQTREDVSHFRLIRTGRANKYMVLMKFRSAKKAREWQKAWNGKLFSAMEPENCHVVFIKSVEFLTPSDHNINDPSTFPHNTNDPFTLSAAQKKAHSNGSNSLTAKPRAPPTPSLIELPTCPVCLERMDETTGLLTILCQHVFHCACLEKWRGSGCPVCRYTQAPSFTFPFPRPSNGGENDSSAPSEPTCSVCSTTSNLWICLICGNTACGRYDEAHAYAHYEESSHCYAMDINTQHVWDYAGDGYVHRLIQNKPDNRMIDLPSEGSTHRGSVSNNGGAGKDRHPNAAFREELREGEDMVPREKMDSMANEYTFLLTSQLEGQRRYYEEQLERAVDKASSASSKAEEASLSASKATEQLSAVYQQNKDITDSVARLEKALEKSTTRADKFEKMAREMGDRWREEKLMNDGLLARIRVAEDKTKLASEETEKLRAEKMELEDMNRDLTIFISSQEKVKELQAQGNEVEMGSVSVPEQSQSQKKKKGKGRKK
ncbi:hypothetical protein AAFC00_004928 [Neodothiora populina]|uniref:Zf-UBP-domain-containing protein n=1 Tax=Neodothiora populina TaxID=2781224 RepID=A0ABR3P3P0_9PEZI